MAREHRGDWRDEAACRGADPELFHGKRSAYGKGLRLCRACPVAEVCLAVAMVAEEDQAGYRYGIWGATTPDQRRALRHAYGEDAGTALRAALDEALAAWGARAQPALLAG
jgi:WhiB family redox-sensing transcriptional regulator